MQRWVVGWILWVLVAGADVLAQPFGNEWIRPGQSYLKIRIAQNGVYRLSTTDLLQAGLPATLDPAAIQLFRRGVEQAIWIQGEADRRLDPADYLEFWGEANDGQLDSLLYQPSRAQPHPYYSAFTDTASYFLTWRLDGQRGKRMATYQEANTSNLAPEPYHWAEELRLAHVGYYHGLVYPQGLNNGTLFSHYDFGEGWTGPELNQSSPNTQAFRLNAYYRTGPRPEVEWLVVGINATRHLVEFGAGQRLLGSVNFNFQANQRFRATLEPSDISPDGSLTLSTLSKGNSPDLYAVSYVRLRYPQRLALTGSNTTFSLRPNASGTSYVEISNVPESALFYDLSDRNTPIRLGYNWVAGQLRAVIGQTQTPRSLYLDTEVLKPLSVQPVRFRTLPSKANYLIVSDPSLRKTESSGDPVRAYAAYRASKLGGGYDTLCLNVTELYDLFSYGDKHTLAIRRFADLMAQRAQAQFLFLIGQPFDPPLARFAPQFYRQDVVPTGGYPASDWVMVMGINGLPAYVPGLAVGRLNTDTPQGVLNYLNKVKEHEATPMAGLWHKNVLHLSGGQTPGELAAFRQYMDEFGQIAQAGQLPARVTSIAKRTDSPVEFLNVTEQINQGVGLITFFGHSGANIADVDIGLASNELLNYRNKGRYPAIVMNGCDAGWIFGGRNSFGRDWLTTPDKGAVLFLASTYLGFPGPLRSFSGELYRLMFDDPAFIAKPFGNVVVENIRRLVNDPNASFYETTLAQQFAIQGDPAVAVFPATKPDFALDKSSLFLQAFGNEQLTATTDSFRLGIIVSNFGLRSVQSLSVGLQRTLNDGRRIDLGQWSFPSVAYQDTLFVTIKNMGLRGGGNNGFEVSLDPNNQTDELNEQNNQASLSYVFQGFAATPLFPAQYGIINTQDDSRPVATLTAQATPVLAGISKNYLFELDTTTTFGSPFRKFQVVRSDFLPTWKTALLPTDSTVYYWRVRDADRPLGNDNLWAERSFTFVKSIAEGWSQSQGPQWLSAERTRLDLQHNTWSFPNASIRIYAKVVGNDGQRRAFQQNLILLNNSLLVSGGNCGDNALYLVALRRGTLQPYVVESLPVCGSPPFAANTLSNEAIVQQNALSQYFSGIADGDFVLLTSAGNVTFDQWPATTKQILASLGAKQVAGLRSGMPYLLLGQKGAAAPRMELFPTTNTPKVETLLLNNLDFQDRQTRGLITSATIGPASRWDYVFTQIRKQRSSQTDTLEVIGITTDGTETTLWGGPITGNSVSLSSVKAAQYPYLKLRLRLGDPVGSVAPQLQRWLVAYTGVPEGVLNLASPDRSAYTITPKDEGEAFDLRFTFKNISPRPFGDSLLVRHTLFNQQTARQQVKTLRLKRLLIGDSVQVTVPVRTLGMAGNNTLNVFFNPQAQSEQYFTNNTIEIPFVVNPDQANPLLEVTFDGAQIADGALVSANPLIQVRLQDENRFLIRQDTLGLDLFWQKPCVGCRLERIRYRNNPDLSYAFQPNNRFEAFFRPKNLSDGNYQLQVQGRDLSGNLAGTVPYTIRFRVKNQALIESFGVSPNPTAVYVRFALTLAGQEPPTDFSLRIFDATGRLVRSFTRSDTPIRVGLNEIFWDGRSQDGLLLPGGMYLYTLQMTTNGQALPLESGAYSGKIYWAR